MINKSITDEMNVIREDVTTQVSNSINTLIWFHIHENVPVKICRVDAVVDIERHLFFLLLDYKHLTEKN